MSLNEENIYKPSVVYRMALRLRTEQIGAISGVKQHSRLEAVLAGFIRYIRTTEMSGCRYTTMGDAWERWVATMRVVCDVWDALPGSRTEKFSIAVRVGVTLPARPVPDPFPFDRD